MLIILQYFFPAPALGLLWAHLFAKHQGVKLPSELYALIFISTLSIYLLDRLAETDRSLIYKRHQIIQNRKTSSLIATLVLVSLGISLLFKLKLIPLPTPFLSIGIGAVIYLMIPLFWKRESRIKEWVKNMLCAGVYAVACASPTSVYSCGSARPSITFLTNTVMLALMILLNLRLIENHEKDVRGVGKHCPLLFAFVLMTSLLSVNVLTVCWTSSSIAMVILSLLPWKLGKPISFDLILFLPALFALIW